MNKPFNQETFSLVMRYLLDKLFIQILSLILQAYVRS